jgi:hypothetical protein
MQCFDLCTLFSISNCDELILLKSRRQIKQTINKYDMLNVLLLEFISPKNIVIINLSMHLIYKLSQKSKPTFLKIPKPTSNMNKIFFEMIILYKGKLLENKIFKNSILDFKNEYIYYILYNNALKIIGNNYIPKYDRIYTFKDDQIYTTSFLSLCMKKKQIPILPHDLITYIGEYVPFIYSIYKIHRISPQCTKCYDKYNAGIITYYHKVNNSDMCGLCNHTKNKHSVELICPPKYTNIIYCDRDLKCHSLELFDAELL